MRNRNIIYIATVIIIVVIASSAFLYINHKSPSQTSSQKNITLLDDEGYTTNLTAPAQRIVSLAPSCTQILYAIGVGDKVVGVTTYDDYPYNFSAWAAAGNMTIDGGYGTPNMEAIASLRPDLILDRQHQRWQSLPSMRA